MCRWQAGKKSESWNGASSSLLQVVVSILGLVLVKEPYYNEAGFDVLTVSADVNHRSEMYSEKTYFRSRKFINHALQIGVRAMDDVVDWLYRSQAEGAPRFMEKAIEAVQEIVDRNGEGEVNRGGLSRVGRGAIIMFKRELDSLKTVKLAETSRQPALTVEKS
jgi:ubiquitin-conjugating enzyme E2 O